MAGEKRIKAGSIWIMSNTIHKENDLADCGQCHSGLPERVGRPHERSLFTDGGRVQPIGTGYDPLPCALWDGERKGKGEANRAAADYRG